MVDLRIKICGITQPEQAIAIANLRASSEPDGDRPGWDHRVTALGFICVEASPRYIEPQAIGTIVEGLRTHTVNFPQRIGVFAQASLAQIQTTVEQGQLSGVQLHGDESPETCAQVRALLIQMGRPEIELIKAVRVRSPQDLDTAGRFASLVDTLLLDAYHPHILGGTGHSLDWAMLDRFQPGCPWLLAGGLKPDNIEAALARVAPAGIDLSSGVERSPGDKDIQAVGRLLNNLLNNLPKPVSRIAD
ncbi:MAG: phosphoribosylanthranilate isomerase [Synechococcales cyanobacterium CRU_2_2]|nr:phosphoribosylanthranilate isomerase [Synechococcales cyanobacterium CRU_2_2]